MTMNNTKSKQFRGDCYIIQLVSTRLSKNRSSHNALVSQKNNLCMGVADRLRILGCIKTLEAFTLISKLVWDTQSGLKKEKFSSNGEKLSNSRCSFLSFSHFASFFIVYFVPDILSNDIYKNKLFFYNPTVWFTFAASMPFSNFWCK